MTKAAQTAARSKTEIALEAAINAVTAAGFVADGETRSESSRRKTGELTEALIGVGGRQRFALPGTAHKVTVGRRTTNFYQFEKGKDKEPRNFRYFDTADLDGIARAASEARNV